MVSRVVGKSGSGPLRYRFGLIIRIFGRQHLARDPCETESSNPRIVLVRDSRTSGGFECLGISLVDSRGK